MDVVVVDSVAALVPKAELEGEMGDSHMALQARLMSQALRKLTSSLAKSRTLIVFLNQLRSKVGVVFGSPDITSGGNALKFYASVRCEIRRTSVLKDKDDNSVGSMVRVKVAKNKMAPPFRVAEFEVGYGSGISRSGEAVDLGAQFGTLKKSGAFYSVVDEALAAAMSSAAAAEDAAAAAGVPAAGAAASAPLPPQPLPKALKRGKRGSEAAVVIGGLGDASAPADAPAVSASASTAAAAPTVPAAQAVPARALFPAGGPFAQGRDKAKAVLDAHPAALEVLLAAVRRSIFAKPGAAPVVGSALPAVACEEGDGE
jgi:hypothetical protein